MHVDVRQVEGRRLEVNAGGVTLVIDGEGDQGKLGFRPVELLLAALGGCTMGTVLSFAENRGIDISGMSIEVDGQVAKSPERVSDIVMRVRFPDLVGSDVLPSLMRVAGRCKVHNTLVEGVNVQVVEGEEVGVVTG